MNNNADKIDLLKQKLSSITKRKLCKELEGLKLRNKERNNEEELSTINAQIEHNTELLKELKKQIYNVRHQRVLVEICTTSENIKIQAHTAELNNRKRSFDESFDKVRQITELRKKAIKENEEEEKELFRQRVREVAEKIDFLVGESIENEKESEAIERECVVLKKRNNAIMLKMRRKLIESENLRKDLLRKNTNAK